MHTMTQALTKIISHSTRYRRDTPVTKTTCECNYSNNYYNDQVCISTVLPLSR